MFLRLQNDVLTDFFRFPTIGSLLQEPILRITTILKQLIGSFKIAARCVKWLPAVFLDGFLALQAPKMEDPPMEDLRWMVSFQPIGTH